MRVRPVSALGLVPVAALAALLSFSTPTRAADHPLEPLRAAELQAAFEAVIARFRADRALPDGPLRFPIAVLAEPPKSFVLSWLPGRPIPRRAEVHVLHYPSNRS